MVTHEVGLGASSMPYVGWGTGFADLDNDGLLDLFVANGHIYPQIDRFRLGSKFFQPNQLYRNVGGWHFQEIKGEMGEALLVEKSSRGSAFADYDNDGDLDILITNLDDRPNLLRNEGGNKNHWLTLQLVGTKSNRDAIGARITVGSRGTAHKSLKYAVEEVISLTMTPVFTLDWVTAPKSSDLKSGGLAAWWKSLKISKQTSFFSSAKGKRVAPIKAPKCLVSYIR